MNEIKRRLTLAIIDENPVFVSFLALCPTLGTTTSLSNAIGMGVSVIFVLTLSNMAVSAIRKVIPSNIRIPVYITIIATLVTVVQMFMEAFLPGLYGTLGIFLPLIVVNCIILGRAESYASKNTIKDSALDGIYTGIGFTSALMALGFFRELLATGSISMLGLELWQSSDAIAIMNQGAGAFLSLGILAWWYNENQATRAKKKKAQRGARR